MKAMQDVLDVLSKGGRIWYEYFTGGLLLMDSGDAMRRSDTKLNTSMFLDLRQQGYIEKTGSMRQGHVFFRGPCDRYERTSNPDSA